MTYDRSPHNHTQHIHKKQKPLPPVHLNMILPPNSPSLALEIRMHEEHATKAIREPTSKQCTRETQEVAEHWNALTDRPSNPPEHRDDSDPDNPRLPALRVQQILFLLEAIFRGTGILLGLGFALEDLRVPQQAYEEVFDCDVAVDDAGDDDRGDCKAVGDLAHDGGGAVQGRRAHLHASVVVDDDAGDEIHSNVATLEESEGLREVSWVTEFGNEAEECNLRKTLAWYTPRAME